MSTSLIDKYLSIKKDYKDTILLFQVGSFYEMFFDDAITTSSALDLVLTTKCKSIPMCGFPVFSSSTYILRMINKGFKIAICDQVETEGKLTGRRVVKIVTPGTVINEYMDNKKFSFLVSIYNKSVACAEVSTGDFFIWTSEYVRDYVYNYEPNEILCHGDMYREFLEQNLPVTYVDPMPLARARRSLDSIVKYDHLSLSEDEIIASGMIAYYLDSTKNKQIFNRIEKIDMSGQMYIDQKTRDEIGINELSKILNKTKTLQGSRLFNNIFMNPTRNIVEIKSRHSKIEEYKEIILENIPDLSRMLRRITYKKSNELYNLALGISKALKYTDKYKSLNKLVEYITRVIDKDNNVVCDFSVEVLGLREQINSTIKKINDCEKGYKIKENNIIGYYIEVSNSEKDIPKHFIRKQSTPKYDRYTTEKIIILECEINSYRNECKILEDNFLESVVKKITEYADDIIELSNKIAEIDLWSSLYKTFNDLGFTKPNITNGEEFRIDNGFHPFIDPVSVVSNSCDLTEDKVMFLTGPNMGGKSTFLKQTAIIVYCTYIGFYVPARGAIIGRIDKIFARIGYKDDIVNKRSVFTSEMLDVAKIVNNATNDSFIIIDELGRSTSPEEGRAIAQAVINYICRQNIKAIISSHDKSITVNDNVKQYNMHVSVSDDGIRFTYKLVKGRCTQSYGIYIASLTSIPKSIIDEAKNYLNDT